MNTPTPRTDAEAGDDCPNCSNQWWYYIGWSGEQEQCEWCWTNPDSKFARKQNLENKP